MRSDPWNDGKVGRVEAQRGHTLIVMVGEYCGAWGGWGGHTVWVSAAVTKGTVAGGGRGGVGGWGLLTFSLWKEWRKFPLSSPSSLGVPGGLLMPLKLFGEF